MTPTHALIHAAAVLDRCALPGTEPDSAAILSGTLASLAPLPADARDAARRHLAHAAFLRSFAAHEPEERAAVLEDCALAQDAMAAAAIATGERYAA